MPIATYVVVGGGQSNADAATYTFTGITFHARRPFLLAISHSKASAPNPLAQPTFTDPSVTFAPAALAEQNGTGTSRVGLWAGMAAADATGDLTIRFVAGTQTGCVFCALEFDGADASLPDGSAAFIHPTGDLANSATSHAIPMPAFANVNGPSGTLATFSRNAASAYIADPTAANSAQQTNSAPSLTLLVEGFTGNALAPSCTWSGAANDRGIGVEVQAAVSSGTTVNASATLTSASTFTATGTTSGATTVNASATLTSTSTSSATATVTSVGVVNATAHLTSTSTSTADATRTALAAATLTSTSTSTAAASASYSAAATLTSTSTSTASATVTPVVVYTGSSYPAALDIADALKAAGIPATVDPRSATPPCVLVAPPDRVYDLSCGYTARWAVWALVPGTGNADAHRALDDLADKVAAVLPVERMTLSQYVLANDAPALPAYRIEFEQGV